MKSPIRFLTNEDDIVSKIKDIHKVVATEPLILANCEPISSDEDSDVNQRDGFTSLESLSEDDIEDSMTNDTAFKIQSSKATSKVNNENNRKSPPNIGMISKENSLGADDLRNELEELNKMKDKIEKAFKENTSITELCILEIGMDMNTGVGDKKDKDGDALKKPNTESDGKDELLASKKEDGKKDTKLNEAKINTNASYTSRSENQQNMSQKDNNMLLSFEDDDEDAICLVYSDFEDDDYVENELQRVADQTSSLPTLPKVHSVDISRPESSTKNHQLHTPSVLSFEEIEKQKEPTSENVLAEQKKICQQFDNDHEILDQEESVIQKNMNENSEKDKRNEIEDTPPTNSNKEDSYLDESETDESTDYSSGDDYESSFESESEQPVAPVVKPPSDKEINNQIREQLKLFQMGKRKEALLNDHLENSPLSTNRSVAFVLPVKSIISDQSSFPNTVTKETQLIDKQNENINNKNSESNNIRDPKEAALPVRKGFIDSLIHKIQANSSNVTTTKSTCDSGGNKDDQHNNIVLPTIKIHHKPTPPMLNSLLATPVISKSSNVHSAFVSEALDNFFKENSLDNITNFSAPQVNPQRDDALMCTQANPPKFAYPQLMDNIEKPRTLAEKRQLMAKKTDIKDLMIQNESTVYCELKKRTRSGASADRNLIKNIQRMSIPFTRDCWRAITWLRTENGKFYYQTVNDDGCEVKICGGKGNFKNKITFNSNVAAPACKLPKLPCRSSCHQIKNVKINNLTLTNLLHSKDAQFQDNHVIDKNKVLNTINKYSSTRPAPHSKKKLNDLRHSIDLDMGPLESYNMPRIQLEVWPRLNHSLPQSVRPYVAACMPYEKITPDWAEFAVSTLHINLHQTEKLVPVESPRYPNASSFTFDIPFCNNQKKILVRKRKHYDNIATHGLDQNIDDLDETLSFDKHVKSDDKSAKQISSILGEMINSIGVSTKEFAKIDSETRDDDSDVLDGSNSLLDSSNNDRKEEKSELSRKEKLSQLRIM